MTTPVLEQCLYSPEISTGSPLTAMPTSDITATISETTILQFPYTSPTTTLTIRNPELGDKFVSQSYRVQRYTRDNKLIVYRDPAWFQTRIFNMAFTGLSPQNKLDIMSFVRLSIGQYVSLTDYLSQTWKGLIINPDNPITQEGPNCLYTWKLDFQVILPVNTNKGITVQVA